MHKPRRVRDPRDGVGAKPGGRGQRLRLGDRSSGRRVARKGHEVPDLGGCAKRLNFTPLWGVW